MHEITPTHKLLARPTVSSCVSRITRPRPFNWPDLVTNRASSWNRVLTAYLRPWLGNFSGGAQSPRQTAAGPHRVTVPFRDIARSREFSRLLFKHSGCGGKLAPRRTFILRFWEKFDSLPSHDASAYTNAFLRKVTRSTVDEAFESLYFVKLHNVTLCIFTIHLPPSEIVVPSPLSRFRRIES